MKVSYHTTPNITIDALFYPPYLDLAKLKLGQAKVCNLSFA
jgi:hypothetical protein